jgi:hypothetical protein
LNILKSWTYTDKLMYKCKMKCRIVLLQFPFFIPITFNFLISFWSITGIFSLKIIFDFLQQFLFIERYQIILKLLIILRLLICSSSSSWEVETEINSIAFITKSNSLTKFLYCNAINWLILFLQQLLNIE